MTDLAKRNRNTSFVFAGIAAGMLGLAFASVPLYDMYCRATGLGGTTQRADVGADRVADRSVTVRFNSDVAPDLPWSFQPVVREVTLQAGVTELAYFRATNLSDQPLVGTATFNVTPDRAGRYFVKIECFCFTEQRLLPGESAVLPVTFFVDPSIADARTMDDVSTITLSYTFFRDTKNRGDAAALRQPGGPLQAAVVR
ncbi:MAG: cytochrome c oxidase assembly protein [Alphaproteobacteria bacterium]|nr:cytochrome c oxidase assembly protein [Alphaproteobacteria bacterium]